MNVKLPFGVKEGNLVHISHVQRGIACGCVCPKCNHPLVARKGNITVHHFAHYQTEQCKRAVETAFHLAAKNILSREGKIRLPSVYINFEANRHPIMLSPERTFILDQVKEEYHTQDIVPDIMAVSGERSLLIEIFVTHAIDDTKKNKIRRVGISAIEIDLSNVCRNFSYQQLEDVVVNGTENKHWIFNAKVDKYKRAFLSTGEKKRSITRGFAIHADSCPITARVWRGKSYANVVDDCLCCDYLLEVGPNMNYIICGGKHKILTLEHLKEFHIKNNPIL
jgi:hypothetical protein